VTGRAEAETREKVVLASMQLSTARQYDVTRPDSPEGDSDLWMAEENLDWAVRRHAYRLGMQDPTWSPERDPSRGTG
jgi:hypothetical protein